MALNSNIPVHGTVSDGQLEDERAHILITDDRSEVKEMVEAGLSRRYECQFTNSLQAAREKLGCETFDLAICDLQTASEAGLAQVEEIVRDHPATAIVLITDVDDPEVTERTFQLGAHGYLVKPFWPGQLLITVRNALRQRELERALQAESGAVSEHLHLLSDTAPVPIYIKDAERRYVFANRVATEMSGMDPGGLVGRVDTDFMTPQQERLAAESDGQVLAAETFETIETLRVGGRLRTYLNLKFPFLDGSGVPAGITGISTDVTSKRQAEALRCELTAAEASAVENLRASRQETVERLARAIETRDEETGLHVARMAAIAAFLAAKLGVEEDRITLLRAAAPMHDIGKIATPDEILHKPGPLTVQERTIMEHHTTFGYQILAESKSELLQMGATIALAHHERWDGAGYPLGLEGEQIPFEGRIAAVADVFDALLTDRVYRPAKSLNETLRMMREGRGSHFDPLVLDVLLADVDEVIRIRGGTEPPAEPDTITPPGKEAFHAQVASNGKVPARAELEIASQEYAAGGIDSLTGVMRRRVGLVAVRREMDRADRTREPFVLVFVDTVGLKVINETQGRAVGDRVLQDVAGCITETLRRYDLVTRVGGDEFVCTLAETTIPQAEARYEQIVACLAERASGAEISIGMAAMEKGDSLGRLVDRADEAMISSRRA